MNKKFGIQFIALGMALIGLALGVMYCIAAQPVQSAVVDAQDALVGWTEGAHFKSVFAEPGGRLLDVIDGSKPVKVLFQHESGWWMIEYTAADGKIVTGYVGFVDGMGEQK